MEWNKLKSGKDMYGGMSLIVAKPAPPDPDSESIDHANIAIKSAETKDYHPIYGLKSIEENVFKGRAPRVPAPDAQAKAPASKLAADNGD